MTLVRMAWVAAVATAISLGTVWAQEENQDPKQGEEEGQPQPGAEENKEPSPAERMIEFMTQRLQQTLDLTEEQVAQVRAILTESSNARTAAEAETTKAIEAELTEEQLAKYQEFRKSREEARRNRWQGRGEGERGEGDRPGRGEGERGEGDRPGRGEGGRGRSRGPRSAEAELAELQELLGLSEEQAAAIKGILEKSWADRQAARDQETERIKGILNEEQAALYEEMRARRGGGWGPRERERENQGPEY
ncbi:MAG: hypothetical protein HY720_11600 [Planctomycetes bacterium]|nr:hypothetical protein [Planctomycetota bacterium]